MCQQGFCMLQGYAPQTLLYMWVTQRYFKMQILTSEVQGEAWGSYISNKFPDEARVTVPPHLECYLSKNWGFPGGTSGKEPACQCGRHKRHGFDPWVGQIPWRKAWQPTPVFLPEEFLHGHRSLMGYSSYGRKQLDMTEATKYANTSQEYFDKQWSQARSFSYRLYDRVT